MPVALAAYFRNSNDNCTHTEAQLGSMNVDIVGGHYIIAASLSYDDHLIIIGAVGDPRDNRNSDWIANKKHSMAQT